jgi:cytochrome oxidase assembly protein ShyY1
MNGYGFLRQPRWLALGFLVLVIVPSFVLLSRWQLHRLDERRLENAVVSSNAQQAPVPVGTLLTPGEPASTVTDTVIWRQVSATGRYDAAGQVLVRKRPFEGANGFWVATPLVTDSGAVLVVNRGWIAASGGSTAVQDVPPPPSGEVTVVGRLQPSQDAPDPQPSDLPAGQVTDLDVALVAGSAPVYPGYVDLVSSDPAQAAGLMPWPLPDLSEGNHLSYAMQWVVFALIAVGGFVLLVRREREGTDGDAPAAAETEKTTRTDVA